MHRLSEVYANNEGTFRISNEAAVPLSQYISILCDVYSRILRDALLDTKSRAQ